MRRSRPSNADRRKSSTPHYQTFPTAPPKSKGRPPSKSPSSPNDASSQRPQSGDSWHDESPLPLKQLVVLAFISLCEQTALNSISPYLPEMASKFPEVHPDKVGLYVGLIASAFALAQFTTNFFWGWLSDRIGRKPVILLGTLLTSACFLAFGFCRTLWQALIVQTLLGLGNGNQGVVSTCLGEITDRSNQSKAFTYLPVVYGIGGITGPLLGGLLTNRGFESYPYLAPNIFSSAVLLVDLGVSMVFLEESLEEANNLPPLGKRIGNLFAWAWQFASSSRPSYLRVPKQIPWGDTTHDDGESDSGSESGSDHDSIHLAPTLFPESSKDLSPKEVLNRNTILLLTTYLIFQLSNISYNSLYPIFAQAPVPTGRNLSPEEIGLSLSFAGVVTILFQVGLFNKIREKVGNKVTYRMGLGGFVLAFLMMPWVGYKEGDDGEAGISSGKAWLWAELGFVLFVKTVAGVGGLTSALLLITNSAPNHSVLGTLNGLAQTLSAAGRAIGPFLAGGLFSLATRVEPKGEAVAFAIFGGIAFMGFLGSFGIRGSGLEAGGWDDDSDGDDEDDEEDGLLR